MSTVDLREIADADLDLFFEFQRDPEAIRMAAFTAADPDDRAAFDAHWAKIRANETITNRTILADGAVAGHVACFPHDDKLTVSYWVDRAHWGKGVATRALAQLLTVVTTRPLHARAAKDNLGSLAVLRKCGFVVVGEDDTGFANGRGEITEEYLLQLS